MQHIGDTQPCCDTRSGLEWGQQGGSHGYRSPFSSQASTVIPFLLEGDGSSRPADKSCFASLKSPQHSLAEHNTCLCTGIARAGLLPSKGAFRREGKRESRKRGKEGKIPNLKRRILFERNIRMHKARRRCGCPASAITNPQVSQLAIHSSPCKTLILLSPEGF